MAIWPIILLHTIYILLYAIIKSLSSLAKELQSLQESGPLVKVANQWIQ